MTKDTTKTREQELAEQFKTGLDPDAGAQLAARFADLEKEVTELAAGMADLGYSENGGPEDVSLAGKAILALRGVAADRDAAIEARDAAEAHARQVEAAHDALVKRAKAKVSQGAAAAKPRKIGPMDGGLSGDALKAAIVAADKVEIVLSDGNMELTRVKPILVEGEVWRDHALGLMLRDPVEVTGPAAGEPGFQIVGYGLLLDGKQVAWCRRSDPINVAGGHKFSLADDIYF